jgi:CoB--CoM heterodisulfide reductase subunit B
LDTSNYAFFWGCQIPARLPFMEKSTRVVLDQLGISYQDMPDFTCCPEKSLVKNFSQFHWLLTAVRNLAVAEAAGLNVLAMCNGCYGTLKGAAVVMATDTAMRERVLEALASVGLEYRGVVAVRHLVELLHDQVGTGVIRSMIEKPLSGMRIAAHPGCHMLRPSSAIRFDDPLKPAKYDALIDALGAESVDYHTKLLCCGGALSHTGEAEDSMALTRRKLLELQNLGVDAMTLLCPACFMQFDQKQYMAQRKGEHLHVPVLTYPELLGLALGLEPAELGLSGHRVDTSGFLAKWEQKLTHFMEVKRHLDLPSVRRCYECGACVADCPVAEITESFKPNQLIGMVLEGRIEELLNSKAIWYCVECHTCYELCPQKFGMEKVFATLKHLAIERGLMPPSIKGGLDLFKKTGRLGDPDQKARKKLGLPEVTTGGGEQLMELLKFTAKKE